MMRVYLFSALLLIGTSLFAQHQDASWSARRAVINEQCVDNDSLCNVLQRLGTFEGHLRSFFMTTINRDDYPDYVAQGIGGGLGYYSPIIRNFQLGMSGYIIYNVASSHLGPQAPFANRYELGLFDINNPDNHEDLDRLEDLYLRYYFSQASRSHVQVGKFHLKTPLINLQDGRMRPNLQEGAWMEWHQWKNLKLKAGWLWRTSPRSTIHWFNMGESVGIYPAGRAVNGAKAGYAGHVRTKNVFIGNMGVNISPGMRYELWNYYADALFNISLNQVEWRRKGEEQTWMVGVQYLWQKSLYNDTLSIEKQYITRGERSHSLSARVGMSGNRSGVEWNLNYTRITSHGRFLFPREWGIESFYTFLPRERMEGTGDAHAVTLQNNRVLDKHKRLSLNTGAGLFMMPSVADARLNKYTLPSFYQLNLRLRYKFSGFLHGLQGELLYLFKGNVSNNLEVIPPYYHNKVDMHHFSFVLDYYF